MPFAGKLEPPPTGEGQAAFEDQSGFSARSADRHAGPLLAQCVCMVEIEAYEDHDDHRGDDSKRLFRPCVAAAVHDLRS